MSFWGVVAVQFLVLGWAGTAVSLSVKSGSISGAPVASFSSPALNMRASVFRASLDPLTPLLRSARRDTGFPASASSQATRSAVSFCECAGSGPNAWARWKAAGRRSFGLGSRPRIPDAVNVVRQAAEPGS